jgi:hypothetical protein
MQTLCHLPNWETIPLEAWPLRSSSRGSMYWMCWVRLPCRTQVRSIEASSTTRDTLISIYLVATACDGSDNALGSFSIPSNIFDPNVVMIVFRGSGMWWLDVFLAFLRKTWRQARCFLSVTWVNCRWLCRWASSSSRRQCACGRRRSEINNKFGFLGIWEP